MADESTVEAAVETTTKATRKPAPTRKPATKRKPAAKRKSAAGKKPAAKRKPAARKPGKKAAVKSTPEFATRLQEASRNAFLAGLGFYGKAFDEVQEQFNSIQEQLEERRKKADDIYKKLVKRGEKVEKEAREAMDDIDLPKFELDSLTDRKKLEEQLDKARARFAELKENVGFKKAA